MTTGERIKELRLAAGMTQEELGNKLGVGKSAIAKYENNRVKNLKKYTILKLSEIFDVTPDYLYGKNSEKQELVIDPLSRVLSFSLKHFDRSVDEFAEFSNSKPQLINEFQYDSSEMPHSMIRDIADFFKYDIYTLLGYTFFDDFGDKDSLTDNDILDAVKQMQKNYSLRKPFDASMEVYNSLFDTFTLEEKLELINEFTILMRIKKETKNSKLDDKNNGNH